MKVVLLTRKQCREHVLSTSYYKSPILLTRNADSDMIGHQWTALRGPAKIDALQRPFRDAILYRYPRKSNLVAESVLPAKNLHLCLDPAEDIPDVVSSYGVTS